MKKIIIAVALVIFTFGNTANAQTKSKFGHIDSNELLQLMPERKTAENEIQKFAKSLEDQLKTMAAEYDKKADDYEKQADKMTDLIKQTKIKEIEDLQNRIKDFQTKAQQNIAKKEQDLLTPIIDKAKKAIEDIAKEKGYSYVFDTSSGAVLYSEESDDILPFVKKKLGII